MIRTVKNKYNKYLLTLLFLFVGLCAFAQISDDNLRIGKLPNGMSYYILNAESSVGEVNFFLLQNVGAIVEDDAQNGMAHYLEHMAFNATQHFPNGVMNFLRKSEIYTFNAHTGINETVYQINNIPVSNKPLVDSCLLIVRDWCGGISLNEKDVEKERGIIIEEWRSTRDIQQKIQDAIAPAIYNNSKYAHRNIIGDVDVLRNFRAKDIQQFYKNWYRPDLQAVIVIGDINPDDYEENIKKLFSSIPAPASNAPKRENTEINIHKTPNFISFTDKDNKSHSFGLYQRVPSQKLMDGRDYDIRQNIYIQLFNKLAARRFSRIRNDDKEQFIAASVEINPLVRNYYSCDWDIVPYEGRDKEALEQLLTVREQIRRNGFTSNEFSQLREEQNEILKNLLNGEHLGTLDNFVTLFRAHFLNGTPIEPLREQLQEQRDFLLDMEVEDLNNWVKLWMGDNDNVSFVTYSSDAKTSALTSEEFNGMLNAVSQNPLPEAKQEEYVVPSSLIDFPINPGKVVSVAQIEELDVEKWTLSNGATLLYKYLPNEKRTYFIAASMGGKSVVKTEDLPSFEAMKSLIMRSGLYKYSRNELYEITRRNDVEVNLEINDYAEIIGGNASLSDFEPMLEYIYLIFTKPVFSQSEFQKYVQRRKYLYESGSTSEAAKVQQLIRQELYPLSDRNRAEDTQFYNDMKFERLLPLYNDRFGNANDFTFCIVGGLKPEDAKKLASTYLATLPATKAPKEKYREFDFSSKEKNITKEFVLDTPDESGTVEISYFNKMELSRKEQLAFSVFGRVLRERLFEVMREKESATYNVDVRADYETFPSARASVAVRFQTHREKVAPLKTLFYKELAALQEDGITNQELRKMILPILLREEPTDTEEAEVADASFWLKLINIYVENDGKVDLGDGVSEKQLAEDLTVEDVTAVTRKVFDNAYSRDIVVTSIAPEDKEWVH